MLDLFRGEVYRILHKRNMYLYLGGIAFLYLLIVFIRSAGFTANSVVTDAATLMMVLPAILGGYFFASLFSDDLSAKNLITLVGYGVSRIKIVLTKLILMAIFTVITFGAMFGLHLGAYALFGFAATGVQLRLIAAIGLQFVLMTMGFTALSAVVVYGTQKSTFAVVTYFLLSFNVVSMLARAAAHLANIDINPHLISGTSGQLMLSIANPGSGFVAPGLEYLAYLILAIVAAIVLFKKREMEF